MKRQVSLKGEAGYSKETSKSQIGSDFAARANLSCSETRSKGNDSTPSRSLCMPY
jgi:hypothetical protein